MLVFRRWLIAAVALLACAAAVMAQPALTTIQDVLYKADGSRFNGTVTIAWSNFQAGNTPVAAQQTTLNVVNGVLKVRLTPTTTASAGAQYNVTYQSQGKVQFTEAWAVPPSTTPLRVRDVRVSTGTVVGPAAVNSPILITDVTGLSTELAARPTKGPGYAPARAAVINFGGLVEGAQGDPADCVRVDGSSGPCGSGGGGLTPLFADAEIPSGTVDGINLVFTLQNAPSPASSLLLTRNGLVMQRNVDYSLSGSAISFFLGSVPSQGDLLLASYRYADPSNPLSTMAGAQVICSSTGTSTSSVTSVRLGSCTMPAGLLQSGDRIEVTFQYSHEGTSAGVGMDVRWGATSIAARSAGASETFLTGRGGLGLNSAGAAWNMQSWGDTLAFTAAGGSASDPYAGSITLDFRGQIASTSADTITLRSFSVVRYPAQSNP